MKNKKAHSNSDISYAKSKFGKWNRNYLKKRNFNRSRTSIFTLLFICIFFIYSSVDKAQTPSPTPQTMFNAEPGSLGPIPETPSTVCGSQPGAPLNVLFNVSGMINNSPITKVDIKFSGSHTYIGDLDVVLRSPNGTRAHTLFSRVGAPVASNCGDDSNLSGLYNFTDDPGAINFWQAALSAGTSIPGGNFRTVTPGPGAGGQATSLNQAFSQLTGMQANGLWTLTFRDFNVSDVGSITAATLTVIQCSTEPLAPITDPAAQQLEINPVDTTLLTSAMQNAHNNFRNAVINAGGNFSLNSAYRNAPYQSHIREVWDKWQKLKGNTLPACQTLRTQVQNEINHHLLANLKIRPASDTGPHTQGIAIDVNLGATGLPAQTVINLAAQNGLIHPHPIKDPTHFQLGSPLSESNDSGEEETPLNPEATQAAIPYANVFVSINKQLVNGNYVYSYRVRNNDYRAILAFEVGYNDSTNVSQLIIPPVGWNYDTGLPPGSTTSPTDWNSNLITMEESDFHSLEWRTENTGQNIQPLQIMGGFSVVLPQEDTTYRTSNLRVVFADGTVASAQVVPTQFDFDNDGLSDISIFRPSNGQWWINRSSNGSTFAAQFGTSTDKMTPGDFTGDGKTDIAFWRPSTGFWFVLRSEDFSFFSFPYGTNGDIPATGDYDNDGKADAAVFRPSNSTWFIRRSTDGGSTIQQFGQAGDVPVAADYDGDGRADIAIFRPSLGQWWLQRSTAGTIAFQFGAGSDKCVPGDYTGDGKADVAFWRPSTGFWFVLRSEDQSFFSFPYGTNGDSPAPGDYDGDGKHDAAVFRTSNNTWFIRRSTDGGSTIQGFGQSGDRAVPNAYVVP